MSGDQYLRKILKTQKIAKDSDEMEQLAEHRQEVEKLLNERFASASPVIGYAGSVAKGTLIKESYDLDISCYFPNGENGAGETLADIYKNVSQALSMGFAVEEKTSAIRLVSKEPNMKGVYFHIDVVPGRYTDDTKTDCYLHQKDADKDRLKTNLDVHVAHIKDAGVTDALQILKLWRVRSGIQIKQFVLELMAIDLLKDKKNVPLSEQVQHVWKSISEADGPIKVEDPANPQGNDLMPILEKAWPELKVVASDTYQKIEDSGWETIFGASELPADSAAHLVDLLTAAATVKQPTTPWCE